MLDIVLVVVIVVLVPAYFWWSWPAAKQRMANGGRIREYRITMAVEWLLAAGVLAAWLAAGRPLADLGLRVGAGWWWAWVVGAVVVGLALIGQARLVIDPETRAKIRAQVAPVEVFLPHTRRELGVFLQLALTAAVCEELVYRGYLMWIFEKAGGPWLAILGSTAAFALAHLYQHPEGIARVTIAGVVGALVFWWSGSLLPVVLLHAAVDAGTGLVAFRALTEPAGAEPAPAADS